MCEDSRIQNAAAATLLHPDLHKRNIFVSEDDPTVITGIIDWQSASIEPAFWYADEVPDFVRTVTHPSLKDQLDPNSKLCAKAFDLCTQFLLLKIARPKLMDENLFRLLRHCYTTWKYGVVAFRHELIETSRHWKELGFTGLCPFPMPAPKELAAHQREYRYLEVAHNLGRDLPDLLNTATDGWVPSKDWQNEVIGSQRNV